MSFKVLLVLFVSTSAIASINQKKSCIHPNYEEIEWLSESQMADLYTNEMILRVAKTDMEPNFQAIMENFNEKLSVWLDEKNIDNGTKASKAYLSLTAVWYAIRNTAYSAIHSTVYNTSEASTEYVAISKATFNTALHKAFTEAHETSLHFSNNFWNLVWNSASTANWYNAQKKAYEATKNLVSKATYSPIYNAAMRTHQLGLPPDDFARIAYRTGERIGFIYAYEHLKQILDAAYYSQTIPWRVSKCTLDSMLVELNKKNGATDVLLTPFTKELWERVDTLPQLTW